MPHLVWFCVPTIVVGGRLTGARKCFVVPLYGLSCVCVRGNGFLLNLIFTQHGAVFIITCTLFQNANKSKITSSKSQSRLINIAWCALTTAGGDYQPQTRPDQVVHQLSPIQDHMLLRSTRQLMSVFSSSEQSSTHYLEIGVTYPKESKCLLFLLLIAFWDLS